MDLQPLDGLRQYPHVTAAVFGRPWALQESKLHAIAELVRARLDGWRVNPEAAADIAAAAGRAKPQRSSGTTAVLPLFGTLMWRTGPMEQMSGATSLSDWGKAFDAAVSDPQVRSIVIPVDSPGGTVDGVPETAAKLFAARGSKPITAVVDPLAASAALWVASAATELVATPSGLAGSVGVYMLHADETAAAAAEGVTYTFVEAPEGGFKTEGSSLKPLDDAAKAYAQGIVNDLYGWFVADLARFRGLAEADVRDRFGRGRVMLAEAARRAGMVDRIATLDQVLERHGGAATANPGARAVELVPDIQATTERERSVYGHILRFAKAPAGAPTEGVPA